VLRRRTASCRQTTDFKCLYAHKIHKPNIFEQLEGGRETLSLNWKSLSQYPNRIDFGRHPTGKSGRGLGVGGNMGLEKILKNSMKLAAEGMSKKESKETNSKQTFQD